MPAVNAFKNRKYPQKYPLSNQPKKHYKAPVTAYGDIISLPSTVVKGQVSVSVKGNTEVNEEGNTKSTLSAIRLKSVGKNLFDIANKNDIDKFTKPFDYWIKPIKLKPNTTYRANALLKGAKVSNAVVSFWSNGNSYASATTKKDIISLTGDTSKKSLITDSNPDWRIALYLPSNIIDAKNKLQEILDNYNIQLEEGTVTTPYEPYTESTQYLPYVGELRSLPNGTKDEVNASTGVKTQRNGEFVFDGSENYDQFIAETYSYRLRLIDWVTNNNAISDKANSGVGYAEDGNYIVKPTLSPTVDWKNIVIGAPVTGAPYLYIHIPFSYVDNLSGKPSGTSTLDDVKNYLNQYPITLIYQLAEPIETYYPKQELICYPNGTIYIEPVVAYQLEEYVNGITIDDANVPIQKMDYCYKLDTATGEYIDVLESVTVASDGLSFSIDGAVDGEYYEYGYWYDRALSTLPEIEYSTPLGLTLPVPLGELSDVHHPKVLGTVHRLGVG